MFVLRGVKPKSLYIQLIFWFYFINQCLNNVINLCIIHITAARRGGAPDAKRVEWGAAPLVFDDSFEHDVIHEGADPRIVLVLDAWHPELPPERRRFELYGRLS